MSFIPEYKSKTYYASTTVTVASSATDIFEIFGDGSKRIRIKSIELQGVATASAAQKYDIVKRTAKDTGGTATNPSIISAQNTNDYTRSTATLKNYSANPTAGAITLGGGTIKSGYIPAGVTATGIPHRIYHNFADGINVESPVLNVSTESIGIHLGGSSAAGLVVTVSIVWTEEEQ